MRRRGARVVAALVCAFAAPQVAAQEAPSEPMREVNITQGSEPGWIPSEALEAEAVAAWESYFALLGAQDYDAAHAMLSASFRETYSLDAFREEQRAARERNGRQVSREPFRLTWTRNAPGQPEPGTYVAIDNIARFERAERHCGYVVLHRAPGADRFTVSRVEDNMMDDASAAMLAENHSPLQRDLVWHLLARNCPGYTPPPLAEEAVAGGIEAGDIPALQRDLAARDGIESWTENGWTIIAEEASYTVWSFAPEDSPAHPTVIRRRAVPTGPDTSRLEMGMRCGGEKALCDAIFTEMALANGFIPVALER